MKSVVLGLIFLLTGSVFTQKYATVDLQLVVRTVKDGIRVRTKLEKIFNKKQKTIKNMETEIQKLTEQFRKKAKYMSPEKRETKQQELQQKMLAYREFVAKAQEEMQKKQIEETKPIVESAKKVVSELAKKGKYDLVYDKMQSGIFYAKNAEDITNKVIKRYNEIHK